jgi:hypothetical protein
MYFQPHKTGAYNYMLIWVHKWQNACRFLFRCSLCKQIREQRKRASNIKLEQEYLARLCMQLSGGGPYSRRLIVGQVETNVEVYKELDSEDDD